MTIERLIAESNELEEQKKEFKTAFKALKKKPVHAQVLHEDEWIDRRGCKDIRSLTTEVEALLRVRGSALFQRRETQISGVTTLSILYMEQQLDNLNPVTHKRYIHQYNFPPYYAGETGWVGLSKRREIGHGHLTEVVLVLIAPSYEEFPYVIYQVSEIMGSNSSSSMGPMCASTLSLLNVEVPLRVPIADIAMGLVSEPGEDGRTHFTTLTDTLGTEDAFGNMDLKVTRTKELITVLQLDAGLDEVPSDVLVGALGQTRDARLKVPDMVHATIDTPDELIPTASRAITVNIPMGRIGRVIGPKGKMVNQIQEDAGTELTIEDSDTVHIGVDNGPAAEVARNAANAIANPQTPKVGEHSVEAVMKTTIFEAFISLTSGKDGLLRISQICRLVGDRRVRNVEDALQVGQQAQVEVDEIDQRGRLNLFVVMDGEAATTTDENSGEPGENEGCGSREPHRERRDLGSRNGEPRHREWTRHRTRQAHPNEDRNFGDIQY